MVDQAAQMTELSSLITIAWYNPVAWLFAGDDCQIGPHLALDVDGKIRSARMWKTRRWLVRSKQELQTPICTPTIVGMAISFLFPPKCATWAR
jgi:hypothetical protein